MARGWFANAGGNDDDFVKALSQIEEKAYAVQLLARGFAPEQIRTYGFAFEGKTVLIGQG